MAPLRRLELPAFRSTGGCSNQLSYSGMNVVVPRVGIEPTTVEVETRCSLSAELPGQGALGEIRTRIVRLGGGGSILLSYEGVFLCALRLFFIVLGPFDGAGGRDRTDDLTFTRRLLWPAELHRHGARTRDRTGDLTLTMGALYQLSYGGETISDYGLYMFDFGYKPSYI